MKMFLSLFIMRLLFLQYIFKYLSLHFLSLHHSIMSFTAAQLFFSR